MVGLPGERFRLDAALERAFEVNVLCTDHTGKHMVTHTYIYTHSQTVGWVREREREAQNDSDMVFPLVFWCTENAVPMLTATTGNQVCFVCKYVQLFACICFSYRLRKHVSTAYMCLPSLTDLRPQWDRAGRPQGRPQAGAAPA